MCQPNPKLSLLPRSPPQPYPIQNPIQSLRHLPLSTALLISSRIKIWLSKLIGVNLCMLTRKASEIPISQIGVTPIEKKIYIYIHLQTGDSMFGLFANNTNNLINTFGFTVH